ncbi:poly [ADP-ribose] polymerase 2 isoform X2 [Protopterus annectens]|uniref:poly [ADP-ribose] polymerase 2 isoform X2 n=1 Tax=Protopterus annectens TaxID=7888 RepID=UPI001CFA5DCD|nr:poly [ADP-ribose] polymerase 2 isoform X2 [Protopterus annectens]
MASRQRKGRVSASTSKAKKAEVGNGDCPASGIGQKRKIEEVKEEEELNGRSDSGNEELVLRWEWENDEGAWSVYSAELNKEISEAFRSSQASLTLSLNPNTKIQVDLKKLTQKNLQTGFERRVRLGIEDRGICYVWEWEGDDANWVAYSAEATVALETAQRNDEKTVSLTFGKTQYTLDLGKMVQINSKTKYRRKIRREESAVEEAEETPKPVPSSSNSTKQPAKRNRGTSKQNANNSQTETNGPDQKETVKTLVVKGKAPVDAECKAKVGKAHVYCEGEDIFDVMLNQTNLQFNNNKYYIIQLLEDDNKRNFSVWMRWGRVGKTGQNSLVDCGANLQKAKEIFAKKFFDKTKNEWEERSTFEKVAGKYDLLQMDYTGGTKDEDEIDAPKKKRAKQPPPESKLDKRIQDLVELICNIQAMEETVMEMKYDTKKAPLGKLTVEQIKAGYKSLKKIEDCINRKVTGKALLEACNEFYTRIPHDFGLKTPPIIRTREELKEKINLLETLSDIQIAIKMVKSELETAEHPVDRHYNMLHCALTPVEKTSPEFQVIENYLQSTHASTHNDYTMKILEIFEIKKEGEEEVFRNDLSNRVLLWHGSRLSNYVGILSKGLQVAPPEAPVTGYMFGKGIYFADMSSKSANYCFASRQKNTGLLLLCEVALGESNELLAADYDADKLPKMKHSTKGLGKVAPDPSKSVTLHGAMVPIGPAKDTGVINPGGYTLNYNEYIVYKPEQVFMKYLLKIQFNFTALW